MRQPLASVKRVACTRLPITSIPKDDNINRVMYSAFKLSMPAHLAYGALHRAHMCEMAHAAAAVHYTNDFT